MTNHNDLVSIIVPIYGTEAYLPACIDSLCKQSYSRIQIILVDDKSPDKCPSICDNYARIDERIIVIHQENMGVSGARNTGLNHATGEYIMFVDSDDELELDAVQILLEDAKAYSADIVSAKAKLIDEKGNVINNCDGNRVSIFSGEESLILSLEGDQMTEAVWAKLFRANFIRDIYFEEGKNIHEDGFFIFQCCVKKPILIQHDVPVYRYNIRAESCSRQAFSDKYLAMLYFFNQKKEIITERFPQYIEKVYSMEVRTCLQLLDLLCTTRELKYRNLELQCITAVRKLHQFHKPINMHHKKLVWIVTHGLYPIYKIAFRIKFCR